MVALRQARHETTFTGEFAAARGGFSVLPDQTAHCEGFA